MSSINSATNRSVYFRPRQSEVQRTEQVSPRRLQNRIQGQTKSHSSYFRDQVREQLVSALDRVRQDRSGKVDVTEVVETITGESLREAKVKVTPHTASKVIDALGKWSDASDAGKLHVGSEAGFAILADLGELDSEKAKQYSRIGRDISVLISERASSADQALAATRLVAPVLDQLLESSSKQYGKLEIIGETELADGSAGYVLENGSKISQSSTKISNYLVAAVDAALVLTSDASDSEKVLQLSSLGFQAATQGNLISLSSANAGISLASTISNWDRMSDVGRVVSVIENSSQIIGALDDVGISAIQNTAVGRLVGTVASVAGAGFSLYSGVKQAVNVIENIGNLPNSEAIKFGAMGGLGAGAAIGAGVAAVGAIASGMSMGALIGSSVPVVGTLVGAAVGAGIGALMGAFGSGKGKYQMARDAWRDSLAEAGFAQKIDGAHHVALADGSFYNIGVDGKNTLTNLTGTERRYYEVDHSNPVANELIPAAHIVAYVTGVSPHDNEMNLGGNVVGMLVNAATSNAEGSYDAALQNMRSILGSITPEKISENLEMMRLTNKITEQEYGVYLEHTNRMFGTNLRPIERAVVAKKVITQLESLDAPTEQDAALYQLVTDPAQHNASLEALELSRAEEKDADKEARTLALFGMTQEEFPTLTKLASSQ